MDQQQAANSTMNYAKPALIVGEVSASIVQPAADATVSQPSSQTSKQSSSSIQEKGADERLSANFQRSLSNKLQTCSTPGERISITAEPAAANLKSASDLTRQMTEASDVKSKDGAGKELAGSSLKVTQRSLSTAHAGVSTFSGDQPSSLTGHPKQAGFSATMIQDQLEIDKLQNAVECVQSSPQAHQQKQQHKLGDAHNFFHSDNNNVGQPAFNNGNGSQSHMAHTSPQQVVQASGHANGQANGSAQSMSVSGGLNNGASAQGVVVTSQFQHSTSNQQHQQMQQQMNGISNGDTVTDHMINQMSNGTGGAPINHIDNMIEENAFSSQLNMVQNIGDYEPGFDIYADLPQPTPNLDPDNCFKCKNPGDFINCSNCEKPYHLFCADLERMPERVWECFECINIQRDRLIRELKEKQRQKAREREIKKERDRVDRENAKKAREDEQRLRREQKEQRKLHIKMQKIEQMEVRKIQMAQMAAQAAELRAKQMVIGADGTPVLASSLRQTTLRTEKRKRSKPEHVLTPAEREKLERNRLVKSQFQIFSQLYPEYVERNSVRYPIPDALIEKMPELHGGVMRAKPKPMKIDMSAGEFEGILYIWEFCNNFYEFLETPQFKIEELASCLSYSQESDPRFSESLKQAVDTEDLDWTDQMSIKHIEEKGFHMVNHLMTALAESYLQDLFPEDQQSGTANATISSSGEKQNQILASIDKLIENKQKLWPEIIRLILLYAKNEDPDVFGPFDEEVTDICVKLAGIKPQDFNTKLNYQEKVTLFTVLIDCIHETNEFRMFLNKRVEDKSAFNKEKMDIYQQIRDLETKQQEFVKQYTEDETNTTQEQMQQELDQLRSELTQASRTESKPIKDKIFYLEKKKNHYSNTISYYEDQTKKKHLQISRLNEKTYKASIKTTMLGKDADKSEYWHFKDDNTRLYIRMEQEIPIGGISANPAQDNVEMVETVDNAAEGVITPVDAPAMDHVVQEEHKIQGIAEDQEEVQPVSNNNIFHEEQKSANYLYQNGDQQNEQQVVSEIAKQTSMINTCDDATPVIQQPIEEQDILQPVVQTETHYSWFYYEREDQFDELFESLNLKGQRERKLQENLKKIRDRLKLKKAKKVKAPPVIEVAQPTVPEKEMVNGVQEEGAVAQEFRNEGTVEGAAFQDKQFGEATVTENVNNISENNGVVAVETVNESEGAGVNASVQQVEMANEDESKTVIEDQSVDQKQEASVVKSEKVIDVEAVLENQEMVVEDEESEEDLTRHVMFQTDSWEDSIQEAIWFGQKVPQKRRHYGRMANKQQDQVATFFEDFLTLEECQQSLIDIGEAYMAASRQHDREWDEEKIRETWVKSIRDATSVSQLTQLIIQLDDGMSLPTSLCSRQGQNGEPGRIQRFKLQLFKFWPSQDMKQAWKLYLESDGSLTNNNLNSLFIILKILETACEQFSVRQAEKMDRKNKQAIMQAVQPIQAAKLTEAQNKGIALAKGASSENDWNQGSRGQRAAVRQSIKYFESSEEEEEEDDDNDEEAVEGQKDNSKMKVDEEPVEVEEESEVDEQQSEEESSEEEQVPKTKRGRGGRELSVAQQTTKKPQKQNSSSTAGRKTKATEKSYNSSSVQPAAKRGRGRPKKVVQQANDDSEMASDNDNQNNNNSDQENNSQSSDSDSVQAISGPSGKTNTANQQDAIADDDEQDDVQSWDEYCFECQDGGNVMCCENCPKVAHYQCIGLKTAPKGDWWCKDCLAKKLSAAAQKKEKQSRQQKQQQQQPEPRSNVRMNNNSRATGTSSSARQATLTSMMPSTRSTRRNGK